MQKTYNIPPERGKSILDNMTLEKLILSVDKVISDGLDVNVTITYKFDSGLSSTDIRYIPTVSILKDRKTDRFYFAWGSPFTEMFEDEFNDFFHRIKYTGAQEFDSIKKEELFYAVESPLKELNYIPVFIIQGKLEDPIQNMGKTKLGSGRYAIYRPSDTVKRFIKLPKSMKGRYISDNERLFIQENFIHDTMVMTCFETNAVVKISRDNITIGDDMLYTVPLMQSEYFTFTPVMKKYVHEYIMKTFL